jgi:hypothetical protein
VRYERDQSKLNEATRGRMDVAEELPSLEKDLISMRGPKYPNKKSG